MWFNFLSYSSKKRIRKRLKKCCKKESHLLANRNISSSLIVCWSWLIRKMSTTSLQNTVNCLHNPRTLMGLAGALFPLKKYKWVQLLKK